MSGYLKKKADSLPGKPGIYFFKDSAGGVVYIGKARSLKDRVRTYFLPNSDEKVKAILAATSDIDYILTDSEKEASFLENNYIQQHQPRFNLRLKDDKSFPYLKLTLRHRYPGIYFSRKAEADGAACFGPFSPAHQARKSIHLVAKHFGIRTCEDPVFRKRRRPCLEYDLGLCSAPCVGLITEAEYGENAANARLFLEGKSGPLLKALRLKMEKAAAGLRFEEAARWRDFIRTVEALKSRPKFISTAKEDQDVVGFARKEGAAAFYVFFMREGKVRDSTGVYIPAPAGGDDRRLLADFLKGFYGGRKDAPKKILLPFPPGEMEDVENMLARPGKPRTRIRAVRSGKGKELVGLANRNALSLIAKKEQETSPLGELARALGLGAPPLRIEGFDISNTLGQESVGSLVVFDDGRPNKAEYRKYRIKTVAGANDVASLEEIVRRRYRRVIEEKKRLPDLVLVDGGKGQLQAARKALRSVGLASVPAASLAKREEIIYTAAEPGGLSLERTSPALKLIQNIRDEAHRFAISFHRTRREKRSFASVLDGIAGIGPVKKKALLAAYLSAAEVASAPLEELAGIVGRRAADSVRAALAGKD